MVRENQSNTLLTVPAVACSSRSNTRNEFDVGNRILFHGCFFAALVFVLGIAGQAANADVIAHWSFDADFTDSSSSSNDLSVGGSDPVITTTAADVKFGGGAADFDGDDWLAMATTLNFGATDPWSISFWGKRDGNAETRDGMIIGEAGTNSNYIWTPDNPRQVRGLKFQNAASRNVRFGDFPDDELYHHWVLIADGTGNIEAYRDNSPQGVQAPIGGTVFTASSVGHAFSTEVHRYYGQIDELYVFDEAIGSDVVDSLYRSNAVPEPTTLLLTVVALLGGIATRRRCR